MVGVGAIGLPDDPSEEIADVPSALGQHADGNHVEHLDSLIESHI